MFQLKIPDLLTIHCHCNFQYNSKWICQYFISSLHKCAPELLFVCRKYVTYKNSIQFYNWISVVYLKPRFANDAFLVLDPLGELDAERMSLDRGGDLAKVRLTLLPANITEVRVTENLDHI